MREAIRNLARGLIHTVFHRPLPPASAREKEAIRKLRSKFASMPHATVSNSVNDPWQANMDRLSRHVLHDNVRSFLRWDVVRQAMVVGNRSYLFKELRYLKRSPSWDACWREAIVEDPVGHPTPLVLYPRSSPNRVHHAYHLAVFEDKMGTPVHRSDVVLEFGGGYGSMCRLIHRLGFEGIYIIFDLPPFIALQECYLTSLGISVQTDLSVDIKHPAVVCTSDMNALQRLLKNLHAGSCNSLFLSTWSLSESPLPVRDRLHPSLKGFRGFLIAYQSFFSGVDNGGYFMKFQQSFNHVEWQSWEIAHLRGSHYLFGKKR